MRPSPCAFAWCLLLLSVPDAFGIGYLTGQDDPVVWFTSQKTVGCSNKTELVRDMLLKAPEGITISVALPASIAHLKPAAAKITFTLDIGKFVVVDQTVKNKGDFSLPHVNIHSCLAEIGACTPFISNTPGLSTHTAATARDFTTTNGNITTLIEDISVVLPEQSYMIIAHVRFFTAAGKYDVAIGKSRAVVKEEEEDHTLEYILYTCGGFILLIVLIVGCIYGYAAHRRNVQKRLQGEVLAKRKAAQGSGKAGDGSLPEGTAVLVDTDVESSTALWEWNAEIMAESLLLHDQLLREQIQTNDGQELLTEGDAFLACFTSPMKAMKYCLGVQEGLMNIKWPQKLDHSGNESTANIPGVFSGLRVRMGVHFAQMDVDNVSRLSQSDMMNTTRQVSDFAHGGQILVSNAMFAEVQSEISQYADVAAVGNISDLNVAMSQAVSCVQLLPLSLKERVTEFLPLYETIPMEMRPPAGKITAIFTYCKDFAKVKQEDMELSKSEIAKLNSTVEHESASHRGYICKGEAGKFLIIFQEAAAAADFSVALNKKLMATEWSDKLFTVHPDCAPKTDAAGNEYNKGLRISIGMVSGRPSMFSFNKSTGKMDYFGQVINRAARTMSIAMPGEICVALTAKKELESATMKGSTYSLNSKGAYTLKGVEQAQEIFRLLPTGMNARLEMFAEAEKAAHSASPGCLSAVSPDAQDD